MKEWRVAESKSKLLVVACEPISVIAGVDPSAFPHASNAVTPHAIPNTVYLSPGDP